MQRRPSLLIRNQTQETPSASINANNPPASPRRSSQLRPQTHQAAMEPKPDREYSHNPTAIASTSRSSKDADYSKSPLTKRPGQSSCHKNSRSAKKSNVAVGIQNPQNIDHGSLNNGFFPPFQPSSSRSPIHEQPNPPPPHNRHPN